jgi:hypothetical protein
MRFSSGTSGTFINAFEASISGAGGTCVSPAPSLAARSRDDPPWILRVALDPVAVARLEPSAAVPNRVEGFVNVDAAPAGTAVGTEWRPDAGDPSAEGVPQTSQ